MAPNSKVIGLPDTEARNERTPLLASEAVPVSDTAEPISRQDGQNQEQDSDDVEEVPLPRTQIFLLCYTSVVEPIAFFGIFPYINFMIENVGNVEKEDVGFYSGLIESLFSATQMCVMIFWGRV